MTDYVHTCEAVVVHCIDFRFQKQISEFLEKKFPAGYDRVALAGGIKELLENKENSIIFKNLQISWQLHQPKTIVLIQHEDCGAYGGSEALGGFPEELKAQEEELQRALAVLQQQFPQAQITPFFIRLTGEIIPLRR